MRLKRLELLSISFNSDHFAVIIGGVGYTPKSANQKCWKERMMFGLLFSGKKINLTLFFVEILKQF
jgi:hypothetical protein